MSTETIFDRLDFDVLPTVANVLDRFVAGDVTAEDISNILQQNPYLENILITEIKTLGLKDNVPSIRAALSMLGMQRVRSLVCSIHFIRRIQKRHPGFTADGKLDFKASDLLPYALKAEEVAQTHKYQYPDLAFAAGMLFDIVVQIAQKPEAKASKEFGASVEEVFRHGVKAARIAMELSKIWKGFFWNKYIFSACLVHDIGKLAMELIHQESAKSYAAFKKEMADKKPAAEVQHLLERQKFSETHEEWSSKFCAWYPFLENIEKAVLFHHEPYLIKTSSQKDLFHFSCLISLASNMANHYRVPKDDKDPVFKQWILPELSDFKITPKQLMEVTQKLRF